jgi:uncharacterized membrane protein YfcA
MTLILILLLVGSIGGFLAGIMGVGGGLVFIPILTYLFTQFPGISNEEAVRFTLANSITLVFASGLSGIYRQVKMGIYDFKKSLTVGIPGAAAAAAMSYAIQHGNWYSHERFTWVFLGFLLLSIGNMLFKKEDDSSPVNTENTSTLSRLLVGFFAGTVVSLSGLGGGIVMVPLFRMILKLPVKKATALSLSVVPLLSVFPIMQYLSISDAPLLSNAVLPTLNTMKLFQTQYLVGLFYIPMALGVVVFSSFGQKTALKTPTPIIRFIFALLSGIILIKTLYELF